MSKAETCPVCDQNLVNAPGIGPICQTKDCPVNDDADLYFGIPLITIKSLREELAAADLKTKNMQEDLAVALAGRRLIEIVANTLKQDLEKSKMELTAALAGKKLAEQDADRLAKTFSGGYDSTFLDDALKQHDRLVKSRADTGKPE